MKYCNEEIHELSWFNHSFIIFSQYLTIPKKAKLRSINVSSKCKQRHSKKQSKTSILLLYCQNFLQIVSLSLFQFSLFFKHYPDFNPKFFSLYQELKQITCRKVLQKTTNRYHHIPQNHIRLSKAVWTYENHLTLTLTFILTTLTPQHPHMTIHGTTQVGQLHIKFTIWILILIIGGLLKIYR